MARSRKRPKGRLVFFLAAGLPSLTLSLTGTAQLPPRQTPAVHAVVTVDFSLYGPIILVPLHVNDSKTLWFELDSGFQNSVIDPKWVKPLGLKAGQKQRVAAPGGVIERATVTGATLRLPGLDISNQVFSAIDQSVFGPFFGHQVDGILGYDFLNRFVVQIDYARRRLTLYETGAYEYVGSGEAIPIDLSSRQPYVTATVRRSDEITASGRFEIDTGSMDTVNLNTPFAEANRIPTPGAPSLAVRGRSLGGETTALLTRIGSLELGSIRLERPVTSIVTDEVDRAGQISGEVLRRFTVIFDYSRRRMILEKNRHFAEPFEADMSGCFFVAAGSRLEQRKAFLVIQSSPADRAGVRAGDILEAVDGRPASGFSLNELREMLKKEGRSYRMTFRRDGRQFRVDLKLRRLL